MALCRAFVLHRCYVYHGALASEAQEGWPGDAYAGHGCCSTSDAV
jgi:hypothetical protein